MTRGFEPPSGFIRLNVARDLLIERRGKEFASVEPMPRSMKSAAALILRAAMLAKRIRVFAWQQASEVLELNLEHYSGLIQPPDGTVFTLVYLRPGSKEARGAPDWLPTAELLLDERGFQRWLAKVPGKRPGRPSRDDARLAADALVKEGKWQRSDKPALLFQLLNERGVLAEPVGRETVNRIAREFGYEPRRKAAS